MSGAAGAGDSGISIEITTPSFARGKAHNTQVGSPKGRTCCFTMLLCKHSFKVSEYDLRPASVSEYYDQNVVGSRTPALAG